MQADRLGDRIGESAVEKRNGQVLVEIVNLTGKIRRRLGHQMPQVMQECSGDELHGSVRGVRKRCALERVLELADRLIAVLPRSTRCVEADDLVYRHNPRAARRKNNGGQRTAVRRGENAALESAAVRQLMRRALQDLDGFVTARSRF